MNPKVSPAPPVKAESLAFKIFQFLFLMGVVILPIYRGSVPIWAFSISIFLIAAGFGIYWASSWRPGNDIFDFLVLDVWVGLYLLFFLIAVLNTQIPYSSLVETFKLMSALLVFLAARRYCRSAHKIQTLGYTLLILGSVLSGAGLLQYFGFLPKEWWQHPTFLSAGYLNHNHFAGFLELVLPISLGMVVVEKEVGRKVLLIFLCAVMGTAFILTLSRGGFISLGIALLFMLFMLWRGERFRKAWWVFAVVAALVFCAVYLSGAAPFEKRVVGTLERISTGQLASLQSRVSMWKGTAELISENILWGTGPGTFEHAFLRFRPFGFTQRPGFAHSDFLQVLSDCGIFVFFTTMCVFIAFFSTGFRVVVRRESDLGVGVGAGCLAAILAVSLHSFIDFNLHIPANWMLAAVVSGLLCSLEGPRYYLSAAAARPLKFFISLIIIFVMGGSIFFGSSNYFLLEAKASLKSGKFEEAYQRLTRSIAINPLNPEAYYLRGLSISRSARNETQPMLRSEKMRNSAKDLDKAISLNAYEPYYDIHRARALADLSGPKDIKSLVPYYREAIRKDPLDPRLYYLAGADLFIANRMHDEDVEKAVKEMFQKCIEIDASFTGAIDRILMAHKKDIG